MLVQKVAPTIEDLQSILSLNTAKTFASVVGNYDDETITELIQVAIEEAQEITNRQFAKATYELTLSKFTQNLKLPKNPIQEVSKIEYMDQDGVYQTLDSSTYFLHEELEIGTIVFTQDVPGVKEHPQAVRITFNCGYSDTNKFPISLKQWLKVRVNTLYEHREEVTFSNVKNLGHVDAVLDRYRIRPSHD